jgi:hypothetical protein
MEQNQFWEKNVTNIVRKIPRQSAPPKKTGLAHFPRIALHLSKEKTPWSESASELYQPSDRLLSAKWLPTFADRGCHVDSVTDPYGRFRGFLDRSRYFSIK